MKLIQKLLIAVVVVILLVIGIAFFLPQTWSVERSTVINATPEKIHVFVENLPKWQEWTDWTTESDPSIKYTYEGPETGVGATQRWTSDRMGKGMLRITRSDPKKGIAYELFFNDEAIPTIGEIRYEPAASQTNVIWKDNGNLGGNPLNRYFGIVIEYMLGKQFESGLAKLKEKVESGVK